MYNLDIFQEIQLLTNLNLVFLMVKHTVLEIKRIIAFLY